MKNSAVTNFTLIAAILLYSITVVAQNLVRNPGFEEYKKLPVTFCRTAKDFNATVKDWTMPNEATADYFHAKCRANASTAKNNFAGFQRPEEGDAYAGIYCCTAKGINYSEYLKTKLIKPLKAGQRYTVQFYISLSEASEYAVDRLGILVMKEDLVQENPFPINRTATVESSDSVFFEDKTGWKQVRLSFVAKGGEKYLLIGNFHTNGSTHLKSVPVNKKKYYKENGCYYYLDDVCLAPEDEDGNCFCPLAPPPDTALIKQMELLKQAELAKKDSVEQMLKQKTETPMVLSFVFFDTDKAVLKPESYSSLDSLAAFLSDEKKYYITISGHTDNSGDENKNQALSKARAKAVADYLISKGINPDRIKSEGWGSAKPVAENETPEGRARNRRVEYTLHL
jgi:OOP family OmpA-OmpF porin